MSVDKLVFTTRTFECLACGQRIKSLSWSTDPAPACECGGATDAGEGRGESAGVIGDECDITLDHVLPGRRFTSKSELNREMAARGYQNHVVHLGSQGSDKSPHTSRWTGIPADETERLKGWHAHEALLQQELREKAEGEEPNA